MKEETSKDILEELLALSRDHSQYDKATIYLSKKAMSVLNENDKMAFRSLYPNISLKVVK